MAITTLKSEYKFGEMYRKEFAISDADELLEIPTDHIVCGSVAFDADNGDFYSWNGVKWRNLTTGEDVE